jgi:hypothetical protein
LRDEGVQRVLKSLLPIVFGLASGQIIALNLPRFLAGGLGEGDLTAIDNANRLMQLPLAVFASDRRSPCIPANLAGGGRQNGRMRKQLPAHCGARFCWTMWNGAAHCPARADCAPVAGVRRFTAR